MDPKFEAIESDANSSFRCHHFYCTSFADDHTWHYHPEYELTWIIQSSGTRFVGDSIEHFSPDDLVLVGPNLPHCWYNDLIPRTPDSHTETMVVQFRKDFLGHDFLRLPESVPIKYLLERAKNGIAIEADTAVKIRKLLRDMLAAGSLERMIILLQILHALASSKDIRTLTSEKYHLENDINPLNRSRIERIHKYVREHIGEEISQTEIAKLAALTPPAFSRFFKKATGLTFVKFVNLLRINEACRLLVIDEMEITEIAYACGYNNISNFNRQFLSIKGLNPSDYKAHWVKLMENDKPGPE
ncbi:AraC family transcriptional regulator [Exilibacterium tricleocarpae]|uniref:AraC family transcriptional regulator n=1 Tax=Exilibacterium tricleocarpae TaxID=2591008 RepID=A0A545TSA5_9GAMM|nr:AraC family transcriptional regulator [Exilibacterium tricleocarpae]TQV80104.1 AraC family transcriptional regulator [Exilibacterium tricleocarpae]